MKMKFNSQGFSLVHQLMAAVSLFWNTNMAAVTSCENAPYSQSESNSTDHLIHLLVFHPSLPSTVHAARVTLK